jgi:hypothetical protein
MLKQYRCRCEYGIHRRSGREHESENDALIAAPGRHPGGILVCPSSTLRQRTPQANIYKMAFLHCGVTLHFEWIRWKMFVMLTHSVFSYLSSCYPTSQMGLWLKSEAGKGKYHSHNGTVNATQSPHTLCAILNATHTHCHNWAIQQINQILAGGQAV